MILLLSLELWQVIDIDIAVMYIPYKCLFKLFNMLLNKSSEISLPTNKSSPELVAEFSTYFTNKITSIRTKLISDEGAQINPIVDHSPCSVPSLKEFYL